MVNSISTQVSLQVMTGLDAVNSLKKSLLNQDLCSLSIFDFLSSLSVALHSVVLGQIDFIWASGERVWVNCSVLEAWVFGL